MVLERRAWTGRLGESLVVAELEQQGHRILQRNWRWRRAEVDVISTDGTALVFHEVKCRSGRDTLTLDPMMWWPHVAQQRRLVQAAHAFVRQRPGTPDRLRFDVTVRAGIPARSPACRLRYNGPIGNRASVATLSDFRSIIADALAGQ